jgi:Uma2 family endonuclease
LLKQLGGIDPARVRLRPTPGTATEKDLVRISKETDRLYELVDGTLVEKVVGFPESILACHLVKLLGYFLDEHDLGILAGETGTMRLMPGLVRIPDVSFVSWDRLPVRGQYPTEPIAGLGPDLAIEVLSRRNTPKEMQRKLKEYFLGGARQVWFVSPRQRTVEVYTAPDQSHTLSEDQSLEGGDVLPGLRLPLSEIFARVPPQPQTPAKGKGQRPTSRKRSNDC